MESKSTLVNPDGNEFARELMYNEGKLKHESDDESSTGGVVDYNNVLMDITGDEDRYSSPIHKRL